MATAVVVAPSVVGTPDIHPQASAEEASTVVVEAEAPVVEAAVTGNA
jgi:hypothetical protein